MFTRRKKRILKELSDSFGKMKHDDFDFEAIEKYYINNKTDQTFQQVSDQIWNDLDLDLFFAYVDRTTSRTGQQYLYDKIRNIKLIDHSNTTEKVIADFNKDISIVHQIQYWLKKLDHKNAYHLANLFQGKHISLPKYFFLIPLLSATVLMTIILSFITPKIALLLVILFPIHAAIHYFNKRHVNTYIYSIPLLLTLNRVSKELLKIKVLKSFDSNKIRGSIKVIDQIKKRIAFFKLEQKIESDLEVIYWFFLEILKIFFLLEPLLLFSVIDRLKKNQEEIQTVFEFVGEVDVLTSIASLRHSTDQYCHPEFYDDKGSIAFQQMVHPLVGHCVSNSITLESRSCLITGSNMSGKTTFIRAIGLNYLSGLVFNTCFAESFRTPLSQIQTIIRVTDDLSSASSYFFQEVSNVKHVLDQCGNTSQIVLLDELFKGTNTQERIVSAKAILSFLHHNNCLVFAATHDIELTRLLEEEYDLYYFSESVQNEAIHFDYHLKAGVPEKGNAIKILKLNHFPEEITDEALHLMKSF